jgi:hypothetical protein
LAMVHRQRAHQVTLYCEREVGFRLGKAEAEMKASAS